VNGYERRLLNNQEVLSRLKFLLEHDKHLSASERHTINSEIREVIDYLSLYQSTEELINQLRTISPSIYNRCNSIVDKKGRPTDIYIKIIHREKAKVALMAASFLYQQSNDVDMSASEYGECTASIEIWISDNALLHLAHELGQVNYIIPNLASYNTFYKNTYSQNSRLSYVGHSRHDQSGKLAEIFEKEFIEGRKQYIRLYDEKPKSLLAMINPLQRSLRNFHDSSFQLVRSKQVTYNSPPKK